MRHCLLPLLCLLPAAAQDGSKGASLDAILLKRINAPKWIAALDKLETNAAKAETKAALLKEKAAKAKAALEKATQASKAPDQDPKVQQLKADHAAAAGEAEQNAKLAEQQRALATNARSTLAAADRSASETAMKLAAAPAGSPEAKGLKAQLDAEQSKVEQARQNVQATSDAIDAAFPTDGRLFPGLESPGVTINSYFGTRWSNLYRDPQAHDTFFRPKGFISLEHEQYFWLKDHHRVFMKWGGGAMIQGSKESDFQSPDTPDKFKQAVNSTDVASAHAYAWLGGLITETTSLGIFLQHQFSNYSRYVVGDQANPTKEVPVTFSDVIRTQRRLGVLIQQHDSDWRGSLLEYSVCADPLFTESRNRQFLRGRAVYNFAAAPSFGFYLEGSINRARHASDDRDDATITLGFRWDLKVFKGN